MKRLTALADSKMLALSLPSAFTPSRSADYRRPAPQPIGGSGCPLPSTQAARYTDRVAACLAGTGRLDPSPPDSPTPPLRGAPGSPHPRPLKELF